MVRLILALVAGVLAGGLTVGIVETAGHLAFPPPAGLDPRDPESVRALMDQVPLPAKIIVIAAWGLGVFIGGFVAAFIARRGAYPAWWVGAILLGMGVWTMIMIPHPIWMWAGAIGVTIVGAFLAGRMGARRAA